MCFVLCTLLGDLACVRKVPSDSVLNSNVGSDAVRAEQVPVEWGEAMDGVSCAIKELNVLGANSELNIELEVLIRNFSPLAKEILIEHRGTGKEGQPPLVLMPIVALQRKWEDGWWAEEGTWRYDGPSHFRIMPGQFASFRLRLDKVPTEPRGRRWRVVLRGWDKPGGWIGPAYSAEWEQKKP